MGGQGSRSRVWRYRNRISIRKRRDIFKKFGNCCVYCGEQATALDHFVPWSHDYDNGTGNLLASCGPCNQAAGNRVFDTFDQKRAWIMDHRAHRGGLVEVYCPKGCGVTYAKQGEPGTCPDCGESV